MRLRRHRGGRGRLARCRANAPSRLTSMRSTTSLCAAQPASSTAPSSNSPTASQLQRNSSAGSVSAPSLASPIVSPASRRRVKSRQAGPPRPAAPSPRFSRQRKSRWRRRWAIRDGRAPTSGRGRPYSALPARVPATQTSTPSIASRPAAQPAMRRIPALSSRASSIETIIGLELNPRLALDRRRCTSEAAAVARPKRRGAAATCFRHSLGPRMDRADDIRQAVSFARRRSSRFRRPDRSEAEHETFGRPNSAEIKGSQTPSKILSPEFQCWKTRSR